MKGEMNKMRDGAVFEKLSNDWKDIRSLVVFGFGKAGRGNIGAIHRRFKVKAIIDNDPLLQGQFYEGIPIVDLKTYQAMGYQEKIVVFTSGNRYRSIADGLGAYGYAENRDFCDFMTFFNDYFWGHQKENYIGRLGLNITTFCTLNCRHCTMHTPYNRYKKNFTLDSICKDVDLIFEMVDHVGNLLILGGEPFLHPQLSEILVYIGEHYQRSIGTVQLITNGTVRASDEVLRTITRYEMEVRISDYTKNVPYTERLEQFCADVEKYQIPSVSYTHDQWLDMGFPEEEVNMGDTPSELREHMKKCAPNCQNVNEGKLYYCAQGWSADQTRLFQLGDTDYLDLDKLRDDPDRKEKFRRFYFGGQEDWYFSFCKVCRGWDTDRTVPGGVQYEKTMA